MANITVDPQVSPFSYTGGTQQVTVTYDVAPAYVCAVTVSDNWIGVSVSSSGGADTTIVVYNVTVPENNGQYRTGSVTFKCGGSGSATTSVNIIRQGTGVVVNRPLWKDTYYEISGYSVFNYAIAYNGNLVYSGKAYKAPDDTYIRFNVTKIAQDWIHQSISDIRTLDDDVVQNVDGAGVLSLCDEFGTEIFNWKYLYQYEGEWSGETHYNMSEPINGHSDPRMKLFYTQYNDVTYYVYPENLLFEVTGGTQEFTVFSSEYDWNITSYPQWVTLSVLSGTTGSTVVTVTVGENQTGTELGGNIVVVCDGIQKNIHLTQYPEEVEGPFTLEFVDTGYIQFKGSPAYYYPEEPYYSVNGGPYIGASGETITIPGTAGDTISIVGGYQLKVTTGTTAHYRAYGRLSTVSRGYYDEMFKGSTKIVDASNLVFDTSSTYVGMFADCTELVTGPTTLPSTALTPGCYNSMFSGCTSLTEAPMICATTLANECCKSMFEGCSSLTTASIPPATSLIDPGDLYHTYAYYQKMYKDCTSLTSVPTIPLTMIGPYVCSEMFEGCTSLLTTAQMPNVQYIGNSGCAYMYKNCTSLVTAYDLVATAPSYYRYEDQTYIGMFEGCSSLVNAPAICATTVGYAAYCDMFKDCTSLVNAPVICLTATTLDCCKRMFAGCTSLVNGPVLYPKLLEMNCYESMFSGCTSLMYIKCMATAETEYVTHSGDCPTKGWVEGVNTYDGVFEGEELYDWEGSPGGFFWFELYSGIPVNWSRNYIPLTLRVANYISPFNKYIVLTHNRTLVGDVGDVTIQYRTGTTVHNTITYGPWTNLTSSTAGTSADCTDASIVQLRGDNARYGSLPLSYTTFSGSTIIQVFGNIMSLIDSTGYTSATTISEQYAFNRLFAGCSDIYFANHLVMPATTVPMHCYTSMFQGCTNLQSAPTLPAPTLTNSCYNEMFSGCVGLSNIRCLATDISAYNCTYNWVDGVNTSGTFAKATGMTGWGSGSNGIPANWTVVDS